MSRSFGLLKPDCLKRGIEREVLTAIEATGLALVKTMIVRLTPFMVEIIWHPCIGQYFWEDMKEFFASGDCMVFIVEGNNAIDRLNEVVGFYDPNKANKGTIRQKFGTSAMENVIHSASDEEAFRQEVILFFQN